MTETVSETIAGQSRVADTVVEANTGETGVSTEAADTISSDTMVKTMEVASAGAAGQSKDNAGTELKGGYYFFIYKSYKSRML